jgi:hypothetical protein
VRFFTRLAGTIWRAVCALFAILAVLVCGALSARSWLVQVVKEWAVGAALALAVGLLALTALGLVRALLGATVGGAKDPVRRLAARLAPHRRPVSIALAAATLAFAGAALAAPERHAVALEAAANLLAFLALRAQHLAWFAGRRDADAGRVRFAASRWTREGVAIVPGFVLLFCGLFVAALPPLLTASFVLGWLAWALPRRYVTVGRDGVLVAQWRERFYPFDGKTTADAHAEGLALVRAGSNHALSLRFADTSPAEGMLLAEQIRQWNYPGAAATTTQPELEASLASLDAAGGYRVAELPRETLWRIVEAPQVNTRMRVRAAELIAHDAAADDLPRLQRLADDLAEPEAAAAIARLART